MVRAPGHRARIGRLLDETPDSPGGLDVDDAEARDKNFGLPVVDKLFGTAYLPQDRRPTGFGVPDPVPQDGYLRQLAYPFRL